jgi:hypothetical protein
LKILARFLMIFHRFYYIYIFAAKNLNLSNKIFIESVTKLLVVFLEL